MAKRSVVIAGMIFSAALAGNLVAAEAEETVEAARPEISVGGGAVISSKPFDGVRAKTYPIPMFTYEGERLYLRGITGGYRLFKAGGWSIGPTLRPRFEGYEASDSSALAGMKNRNPTIDAGIDLSWRTDWGLISAIVVTDILGAHDGHESELSYTVLFPYAGFNIIPSVAVRWRSSNLANYYYGVRDSEVGNGRPPYTPDDSVTPVVRVAVRRKLSERWGLLLASQYEWLSSEIRDSPIVDDNSILSALFGVTYSF
jgi:outer membrane protein